MLNRKKNYTWVYILVAVVVLGGLWLLSQEMPVKEEMVKTPIANTFAK